MGTSRVRLVGQYYFSQARCTERSALRRELHLSCSSFPLPASLHHKPVLAIKQHKSASPFSSSSHTHSHSHTHTQTSSRSALRNKLLYLLLSAGIASAAVYSKSGMARSAHGERRREKMEADTFREFTVLGSRIANSALEEEREEGEHVILDVDVDVADEVGASKETGDEELKRSRMCIYTLHLASPALSIQRPYTPLYSPFSSRSSGGENSAVAAATAAAGIRTRRQVQLLIKKYRDGEVGRFAHSLKRGDQVLPRGFEKSWQGSGKEKELILIAGGTGITPMHQLISSLLDRTDPSPSSSSSRTPSANPKVTLLYCASDPSALCLLPELAKLRSRSREGSASDRLHIQLFVDHSMPSSSSAPPSSSSQRLGWRERLGRLFSLGGSKEREVHGFRLNEKRLDKKTLEGLLKGLEARGEECKVLIAGPDGMVSALAGQKARDGKSQGELGGLLQELGWKKGQVWKL